MTQWCPKVDPNEPWSERCGVQHTMADDGKRHRCHLMAGHTDKHACRCGYVEWK
jgi:ribosomal protein S27AE